MRNDIIEQVLKDIDLPYEVKQKAKGRYEDLGEWLNRDESTIADYRPYIFPQGSFLLQTTIRPVNKDGEYDLDIGCKFLNGLTTANISQKELKDKLRLELESYRQARNIKAELEEKARCWRIEYQDNMSFHIDIVPCIPALEFDSSSFGHFFIDSYLKGELLLTESNILAWQQLSLLITDTNNKDFERISDNWHHSNPEGFAKWFRANAALDRARNVQRYSVRNEVADLPITTSKQDTILQRVVKLLKRHRDTMFSNDDKYAPISVIISKLAADAYNGEQSLAEAVTNVIAGMQNALRENTTNISNPTEPRENYADKWVGAPLYLYNFRAWLIRAKQDFRNLTKMDLTRESAEHIIRHSFKLPFSEAYMKLTQGQSNITQSQIPPFNIASAKTKPWAE